MDRDSSHNTSTTDLWRSMQKVSFVNFVLYIVCFQKFFKELKSHNEKLLYWKQITIEKINILEQL